MCCTSSVGTVCWQASSTAAGISDMYTLFTSSLPGLSSGRYVSMSFRMSFLDSTGLVLLLLLLLLLGTLLLWWWRWSCVLPGVSADEDEDEDVVWDDDEDDKQDTPDVDEQDEELRGAANGNVRLVGSLNQVPHASTAPNRMPVSIGAIVLVLQQSHIWYKSPVYFFRDFI